MKNDVDYLWDVHDACELAEELGYQIGYSDGGLPDEYEKEMREKISSLIGEDEWPQEVNEAFQRGNTQGRYDL